MTQFKYYLIITPLDSKGEIDGHTLASGSYATIEDAEQDLNEMVEQFHPWRHEFKIARVEKSLVYKMLEKEKVSP
tara:strand:- start:732 stop:956 length:225 start_codon:yes stop_codon:yes gene_type:complete